MDLEYVENHAQVASNLLFEQYKYQPKLNSLLASLIQPLQYIEDTLYELYKTSLLDAKGHYLDRIGEVVGELRNWRKDDAYRIAILVRIMINNGGGTPEDIIGALKFTFRPEKLAYTELYPACYSVYLQGGKIDAKTKSLISTINPISINKFVVIFTPEQHPFVFAENSTEVGEFEVRLTNDAGGYMAVNTVTAGEEMELMFEVRGNVFAHPPGALGFGEIIITRVNLGLDDKSIYHTRADDPLLMLLSYEDFIINGGSKLAEVLEND